MIYYANLWKSLHYFCGVTQDNRITKAHFSLHCLLISPLTHVDLRHAVWNSNGDCG